MSDLVTIHVDNHIADVRLNRPEKMNALNPGMFEAITAAGRELVNNKDVRAVVLSGEGRSFCAGLDVMSMGDTASDPFGPGLGGFTPNYYQLPAMVWKQLPVPVICAIQGVAFGGGLQIALGADIRIAHPEAKLSLMEIKWGLIPDMSATQTLRDLVRVDVAKELAYTGRVVEAPEAHRLGLVSHLEESPHEAAMVLAQQIAGRNPEAVSYSKFLFDNTRHCDTVEGLQIEEQLQAKVIQSPNQIEAVMAVMEKREADFQARGFSSFDDIELG